jgi:beta-N-acetylhexosaminidase
MRRTFARSAVAVLGVLLIAAIAGCAVSLPDGSPSIRGTITTMSDTGSHEALTVLIEGAIEDDTEYDRASVAIGPKTEVLRMAADGTVERGSSSLLAKGQQVEAWFTGPVAESYPVQAAAATIVIR